MHFVEVLKRLSTKYCFNMQLPFHCTTCVNHLILHNSSLEDALSRFQLTSEWRDATVLLPARRYASAGNRHSSRLYPERADSTKESTYANHIIRIVN